MSREQKACEPMPAEIAPGLDLFAAAWLEEWTRHGGFVSYHPEMIGGIGFPADAQGPDYRQPSPDHPEWQQRHDRDFNDAHYNGRMRSLIAILDAVPHARQALREHMSSHGMVVYAAQGGAQ